MEVFISLEANNFGIAIFFSLRTKTVDITHVAKSHHVIHQACALRKK